MKKGFLELRHFVLSEGVRAYQSRYWKPQADVYSASWGWLIKLELAGVRREDLEIQIQNKKMVIQGYRRDLVVAEELECQSMEIRYSQFCREFEFPEELKEPQIETQFENGMLLVLVKVRGDR